MSHRSVVLLSGGLDSTVNLYQAHQEGQVSLALTFDYGQKAARKEIQSAKSLCSRLHINHEVVSISFLKGWGASSLTSDKTKVPQGEEVSIDDLKISRTSAKAVWVPNRNGVFLNIAAGYAESLGAEWVVPGFNLEEAQTFPDNSKAYMQALDHSFSFSTSNKVKVKCWTVDLNKTDIVQKGIELGVPFQELWPCYLEGEKWCGSCESCQRSLRALSAHNVKGLF